MLKKILGLIFLVIVLAAAVIMVKVNQNINSQAGGGCTDAGAKCGTGAMAGDPCCAGDENGYCAGEPLKCHKFDTSVSGGGRNSDGRKCKRFSVLMPSTWTSSGRCRPAR